VCSTQEAGSIGLTAQNEAAEAILREVIRKYVAKSEDLNIVVLHRPSLTGDTNEDSLVTRLTCGTVGILLTGDATTDSEASMAAEGGLLTDAEVLKVGHHGSNTWTGDAFLPGVLQMSSSPAVGPWDQRIRPYCLRCRDDRGTLE
jgi:beta-lactamase superfamily II metal-dependent hydrolase